MRFSTVLAIIASIAFLVLGIVSGYRFRLNQEEKEWQPLSVGARLEQAAEQAARRGLTNLACSYAAVAADAFQQEACRTGDNRSFEQLRIRYPSCQEVTRTIVCSN